MNFETLLVEHRGQASFITFNRPPLNLFTNRLLAELDDALVALEARDETRAIVIKGQGERAFSAGADLRDESAALDDSGFMATKGREIVDRIETLSKPVIAAIRGWCIGGGTGIAWVADIRIAAESTKFRASDAYLGMVPTWGVSLGRLSHFIGRNRTLDLLLVGEDVTARQAYEMGLVSKVVPDVDFEAEVERIAQRLASGAPIAFRAIKEIVRAQYRASPEEVARLIAHWGEVADKSRDAIEGVRAFAEKRKPVFHGV
jgi:enoyl-CoA hydratase/carnithine racemase